jgi:hypothetical protein
LDVRTVDGACDLLSCPVGAARVASELDAVGELIN